jgi:hypothetical protein
VAAPLRGPLAFHLVLLAVLVVGAAFDDALAWLLRVAGGGMVIFACLTAAAGRIALPAPVPPWAVDAYPLVMAAILAGYGVLLGHGLSLGVALTILGCWLAALGWWGYVFLRQVVAGLDYLVLSLTLFAVAVLISLGKAGVLSRWVPAQEPDPTD